MVSVSARWRRPGQEHVQFKDMKKGGQEHAQLQGIPRPQSKRRQLTNLFCPFGSSSSTADHCPELGHGDPMNAGADSLRDRGRSWPDTVRAIDRTYRDGLDFRRVSWRGNERLPLRQPILGRRRRVVAREASRCGVRQESRSGSLQVGKSKREGLLGVKQ